MDNQNEIKELNKKIAEYEATLRTIARGGGTVASYVDLCKKVLNQFDIPLKSPSFR